MPSHYLNATFKLSWSNSVVVLNTTSLEELSQICEHEGCFQLQWNTYWDKLHKGEMCALVEVVSKMRQTFTMGKKG